MRRITKILSKLCNSDTLEEWDMQVGFKRKVMPIKYSSGNLSLKGSPEVTVLFYCKTLQRNIRFLAVYALLSM
jgi:hypothetical protein